MKDITDITKKGGRDEEFQDMDLGEIRECTDTMPKELIEDSLTEVSAFKSVSNDEEEDEEETVPETN